MSGPNTQQRRHRFRWMIPASISALLFLGGVAGNLVATDLDPVRKQYQSWVWGFFFLTLIIAVFVAVRDFNEQDEPLDVRDEPALKSEAAPAPRPAIVAGEVEGETLVIKLPATFNALHQLPPPPRDFTGRVRELGELMSQIEKGGVTISGLQGLGGVGKTALALELGRRLAPLYPDAQFYLDLKGADKQPLTVAEALSHVIRAYHPMAKLPEDVAELQSLYLSVLHGQRALLLMDNAAGREQVEPLVPPDSCILLVTSRQHFTLPGLSALSLDTLLPEDARQLLLKIAPRIGESADEIAKLCGYLPLALRLAASALAERPNLSPTDYVRRLSDAKKRLELVEASLTLSYELLNPDQQKLWRALAVFPDTFNAAAAAAVWELDADAAQYALADLLRYSLLDFDADTQRYSLHDLARLFAASRLNDDERQATQMLHAGYYLAVLSNCDALYLKGGDAIKSGLTLFDNERRNIETGQEWACRHTSRDETAARLCNQYPDTGVYVLNLRLHPHEFISWSTTALAAARQLKDRASEEGHLGNLGNAYKAFGEMRRAIDFYEQALVIARELGDGRGERNALGGLGVAYADLGETQHAVKFLNQALAVSRKINDRRGEGLDLGNLGNAYADLGEIRHAVDFYEQALVIARELGDHRSQGNALGNLGNAYADLGEVRHSIEFYEQSLVFLREIGDRRGEGAILCNLGVAYTGLGETRRAVELFQQALITVCEIGDRRGEASVLLNMGVILDKLGDRAKAIAHVEAALEIYEQIEAPAAGKARALLAEWRGEA